MFRVLIVDDSAAVRRSLRGILEGSRQWKICGECDGGLEAADQAAKLRPDAIVMDFSMPGVNGMEATHMIHDEHPEIAIVILSLHPSSEMADSMLAAGAAGYVLKTHADADLIPALEAAMQERRYVSPAIAGAKASGA